MDTHVSQDRTTLDARTLPGPPSGVEGVLKKARPPRRIRARTLAIIAASLLLLALLVVLFAPDPQPVDLARVGRGAMAVSVSSEGITRVKEEYKVTAPVGGRLLRVVLKAGDAVVANQTIVATITAPQPQFNDQRAQAELEAKTRVAQSALAQARADLERTRAQLSFAVADMVRFKDLAAHGVTAVRTLEQYATEEQARRAAFVIAQKAVEQKIAELENTTASLIGPGSPAGDPASLHPIEVHSPISGRVLDVLRKSETVITPGQPILSVGDPGQIEVMLEMLSEDAVKVREGATATLDGWGGPPLNMRVRRVEPFGYTKVSALGIEEQRVHVLLDFTDPPETRRALGHGYRVTGRILLWDAKQVLKLPMGALFRDGTRWAVYRLEGGKARLRHVELGHLNDTEAEVLKGLAEDDQVILHPSDRIAEGVAVRPRS